MEIEKASRQQPGIKEGTMLKRNLITAILKEHPKGNVFTALRLEYLIKRVPVVIKEANSGMLPDHFGRTMRDKLKWQLHVNRKISGYVSVPRIKDFFDYKGNAYLVTAYVEGTTLTKFLDRIYQNRIWCDLNSEERVTILRVLFQLTNELEKMHEHGFVHRDISPENILITPSGKLYLIDLELAYSIAEDYPSPPFSLGTAGFMSPEQLLRLRPTVTEDIFALGAVILAAITNFAPLKFDLRDYAKIDDAMDLFGVHWKLSSMISGCMNGDRIYRTDLTDIRIMLDQLLVASNSTDESLIPPKDLKSPESGAVKNLITTYFRMLISKEFNEEHNPYHGEVKAGLAVPLQGIFYVMSLNGKENMLGTVLSFFKKSMKKNSERFHLGRYTEQHGLFCGNAWNALAFCCANEMGIIADEEFTPQSYLKLRYISESLDFANGIAGQALATLMILFRPGNDLLERNLNNMIQSLLDHQAPDGSWPLNNLRLADGISGILLSLIKYYQVRQKDSVLEHIQKGLNFLTRKYEEQRKDPENADNEKTRNISLLGGSAGIALVLLYGFELFEDPAYLQLAEDILSEYNERYCSSDFSLESGLAGIGVVYIEAARITGQTQWEERAFWIYHLFDATTIEDLRFNRCWNTKGTIKHDASLLSGNAGILYFLIKLQQYVHPNKELIYQMSLF
jgi:serine/threonine protein kinase